MKKSALMAALFALLNTTAVYADEEIETLKAQIKELQEKTDILAEETASYKNGFGFNTIDTEKTHNGMGDGASKVYYAKSPLSIGGYGEMYWASSDKKGEAAYGDVYRFVPYIGYKFSENVIMNTELEFEHGGNEVAIEFMYLDFLLDATFNLRAGHLLVPMGLINLRHEPVLFNTVQRPDVEKYLIPSTWHENGILLYGEASGFSYTAGIVNALDLANGDNVTGKVTSNWIRSGRIGAGKKGTMQRVAFVGRLDYRGFNGLLIGASGYYGDAAQGSPSGTSAVMGDLHASYEYKGFKLKGLYTATRVKSADKIDPEAARAAEGWYANAQFDILSLTAIAQRLPIFVQYEDFDPTLETVSNPLDNRVSNTTFGINYFPAEQTVVKLDYTQKEYRDALKEDYDTLSIGIGFVF